jgi:hypothetical protein
VKRKLTIAAVAAAAVAIAAGVAIAALSNVPNAEVKAAGYGPSNVLSSELREQLVAEGSVAVENPQGIVTNYGYLNDLPSADNPAVPQMAPLNGAEARKTEPDKNTYLVLKGQKGADPNYNYGTHFLFQGHETGTPGYITRINLDADDAHRVTVMASQDDQGNPIADIDGSTWDPFSKRLLFTTENAAKPTYAATVTFPSIVRDVSGALGRGGYEGIQDDGQGSIWIVEDIGGAIKAGSTKAKQPNSFIYRYVPSKPGDLGNGKLQVLQVLKNDGTPITFASESTFPSADQIALHTYGSSFTYKWVTIHDTAVDGSAPFVAGPLAKTAGGTPFKRPENGVFRPGTGFGEFYFTETGDTDATSSENAANQGGWGGVFKVSPTYAGGGTISIFYNGDQAHTGFDNIAFLSKNHVLVVEDAGDTLHTQRQALDSGYDFNVAADYSLGLQPGRFIAEGRDAAATLDAANGGYGKNEGDNEITGIHVSNGDPSILGILGATLPKFGVDPTWRMFWTQQHGENRTWEVTVASSNGK